MRFCIIDDEPIAHRIIEGYCEKLPHLQKAGNCYDAFEAMQFLNANAVDLIFLDINMPKLSGFEMLKTLNNPPKVIVTSAYKEFALEGYELNVVDYLLKPFSFERFLVAINKLSAMMSPPPSPSRPSQTVSTSIFLKGDKKIHQIHLQDILYVEAYGNYCKVYFQDEMILCHEKISSLEEILPSSNCVRIHKSFIISISKIKLIEGNRIQIGDKFVPVGQTYKLVLKQLIS